MSSLTATVGSPPSGTRSGGTRSGGTGSGGTGSGAFVALWAALTGVLLATAVVLIYRAPVELQMGISQKIFYFHVPSAYAMYIGFFTAAIASAVYLIKGSDRAESVAIAGAEVGVLFCIIVLTSGPLWARKAWGVWWTWDPRLTTTLLAGMVFLAYLMLRGFAGPSAGTTERKFAAGLAIFGILDLPVIHYSVQRWRGQHPTVITNKGGGLDPGMYPALYVSFAAFTALVVLMLILRSRQERLAFQVEELRQTLSERGYDEV